MISLQMEKRAFSLDCVSNPTLLPNVLATSFSAYPWMGKKAAATWKKGWVSMTFSKCSLSKASLSHLCAQPFR